MEGGFLLLTCMTLRLHAGWLSFFAHTLHMSMPRCASLAGSAAPVASRPRAPGSSQMASRVGIDAVTTLSSSPNSSRATRLGIDSVATLSSSPRSPQAPSAGSDAAAVLLSHSNSPWCILSKELRRAGALWHLPTSSMPWKRPPACCCCGADDSKPGYISQPAAVGSNYLPKGWFTAERPDVARSAAACRW